MVLPIQKSDGSVYWIYILKCSNGSYYTGITTDVFRRFKEHQLGTSKCKYTRAFAPLSIEWSWKVGSKSIALKIEKYIKKFSKQEKEKLIQSNHFPLAIVNFLASNNLC